MSSRRNRGSPPKPASPARTLAFRVLRALERGRAQPAALLERHAPEQLSAADRDLATELVYGVLRWQGRLDFTIEALARRSPDSLDPALRICLRLGLYQLRFLDRIPVHAAVDESVRLAKSSGAARGAGLVNAVLRSALRKPGEPELPSRRDDLVVHLAVASSHPAWLVKRYASYLDAASTERRLSIHNQPPPVYLRVTRHIELDRARTSLAEDGVTTELVPEGPRCLRVTSGRLHVSRVVRDGLAMIQDLGSQLIPHLLHVRPADRILDVCASPGGKATLLAELVPEGRVTAVDLRYERASSVSLLARRLRTGPIDVLVADGKKLPLRATFSRILLDVPCSSLGTLRRNPDIKWRLSEEDIERLAREQNHLLEEAASSLAPGGRLVYATCSTEREENEAIVEGFLAKHQEFRMAGDSAEHLPDAARRFVNEGGTFATRPERDATDGYFAVALVRSSASRPG